MSKELRSAMKRLAVLVVAFVIVVAAVTPALAAPAKKAPSLNTKEVTIVVGKSFNFNIVNKIKGATYSWRISNEEVAVVNEKNGTVTGVGKGTTNVFCRVSTGTSNYLLRGKVTVLKPAVKVTIVNPVEELGVGDFYQLKVDVVPESANDIITWTSSNKDIIKIDKDGSFVTRKAGTVTLTAKALSERSDSVTIKVGGGADDEVVDKPEVDDEIVEEPKDEVKLGKIILEEKFETSVGGFAGRQYSTAKVGHSKAGKAAEGKGYISVTGRTATWHGAILDITNKVTPGASYQVTAWVRYTSGDDVEVIKASMQALTREGDTYPAITGDQNINKGTWTQITGVMVVPPSSTKSQIYFEANSLIDFYVDHLIIQEIDADIVEEDLTGIELAKVGDIVYKNDFEGNKVLDSRGSSERTITTDEANRGKASLNVTRTLGWDGAGVKFASANDIEILSLYGKTVHAGFYVMYKDGPEEVNFKLNNRMEQVENTDNILSQIAVKKGEWTLIEADCYIAEKTQGNMIFIETEGDVALTFYVDDVELKVVK